MKTKRIFIIAEAGVNHNGSLKIAKRLIDAAAAAGADAVKFQSFRAEEMTSGCAPKAEYQKASGKKNETQLEMLRKLELDEKAHRELISYSRKKKIEFMSSPFDIESVGMLKRLGLKTFKIPSGEITNYPYLKKIGSAAKRVILSTGMSTFAEVKRALAVLTGAGMKKKDISLLQCTSEYPARMEDVNLLAMETLGKNLSVESGYSDHTLGTEMPIAAAALGARIIEKHFTLRKTLPGPDHGASLEPHELKAMVSAIRNVEKGLGNGEKKPAKLEIANRLCVRKSLVASISIKKGERFSPENVTAKRPGTGISPMEWNRVISKKAKKNFAANELIRI